MGLLGCERLGSSEFQGSVLPVGTTAVDAGALDAGTPDAGTPDAGTPDAGTPDAGTPDAGTPDAGTPDAGTPDAGTPDAGTPDAGTPDAGTPDAGTPDAGTPDAGTPDAGLAFTGVFSPSQLVIPPGASGHATVSFPIGAPRTLVAQVVGTSAVTPPQATLSTCVETSTDVSCDVTVRTTLETSVRTSWSMELSAPAGPSVVASLPILMADDPLLTAELTTAFKEAVPRAQVFFGLNSQLAAEGTVALLGSRSGTSRWSVWGNDGGWAEEAVFEGGPLYVAQISRDSTMLVVPEDAGTKRILTRTVSGWADAGALPGLSSGCSLSADGTWIATTGWAFNRVFARDAGTWVETFSEPLGTGWGQADISDDGSVLATSVENATGSVTVYRRSGDQWLFDATLAPASGLTAPGRSFGWRLVLSADGSTLVLFDLTAPPDSSVTGKAHVFRRMNGLWSEEAVLRPDPGYSMNQFGWGGQLSAAGNRLVVGASAEQPPRDGGAYPESFGAIYVFTRHGTSWVRNLRVSPPVGSKSQLFGETVSVSTDGRLVLVSLPANSAGAPGINGNLFDPAPANSGAAWLYRFIGDGGTP